jgi:hypothetical protein
MAYARHQSFYLRDKWLSKGIKALNEDPRFFYDKDGFEKIGLGKNMVQALKFWLSATEVVTEVNVDGIKEHHLTELGKVVADVDRLLQKSDVVSILHYHLVRNNHDLSTVFYWYFNIYKETITQRNDLKRSFATWVKNNEAKPVSEASTNRDIDCLVQLYTKSANENDPEDFIFSPFTKINLLKEEPSEDTNYNIRKFSPEIEDIGQIALYYTLLCYAVENEVALISLDEIIEEDYLWGKVFHLSRNKIIETLNKLTNHDTFPIEYVRTNNLDNVRVPSIEPLDYLKHEFGLK